MKKINSEIVIIGGYGGGNIGDDFLMWNVVKWINLNFPKITPTLVVEDMSFVHSILKGCKYNVVDSFMSFSLESELAIYGGGTQFFHFEKNQDEKKNHLIDRGITFLKSPIKVYKSFMKKSFKRSISSNKKMLLGIGFGPFHDMESEKYKEFLKTLELASYVFVRDNRSYDLIPKTYKNKSFLGTDLFYNSNFSRITKEWIQKEYNKPKEKIGFILRYWGYNNINQMDIYKSLREYIRKNKEQKFEIVFVCEILDSRLKKHFNDLENVTFFSWNPKNMHPNDFLSRISTYQMIVTSRFHGAIFSALLNVPFITIEIEPKLNIPNILYENNHIWKKPFKMDDLEHLIKNISKAKIDYPIINAELIKKGDEMLLTASEIIKKLNV